MGHFNGKIGRKFRAYGEKKPRERSWLNFAWVGVQDLITYAAFGDDRLKGLGVAMDRISCVIVLTTLLH